MNVLVFCHACVFRFLDKIFTSIDPEIGIRRIVTNKNYDRQTAENWDVFKQI
jgi:hypothetical protein